MCSMAFLGGGGKTSVHLKHREVAKSCQRGCWASQICGHLPMLHLVPLSKPTLHLCSEDTKKVEWNNCRVTLGKTKARRYDRPRLRT